MEKLPSHGAAGCKPLTTFVQTNTNSFREVVQRLTGPSETFHYKSGASSNHHHCFSPSKSRESSSFPPSPTSGNSNQLPSPKTPSTIFSRLTILEEEKKEESGMPELNIEEEEKAIKERRFYLHPSPRSKPGFTEPELLTLFPLASPNTS